MLLIPVAMVRDVIRDRENNRDEAIADIHSKWGAAQTIAGPVLTIPYDTYVIDDSGRQNTVTQYAHFLPSYLNIEGTLAPEYRTRGIYDAVVYGSDATLSGTFDAANFVDLDVSAYRVQWDNAFVSLGIPDMRGIDAEIALEWDGETYAFQPGIKTNDVIRGGSTDSAMRKNGDYYYDIPTIETPRALGASGVSVDVPMNALMVETSFSLTLSLNGSDSIEFVPVGRRTEVSLTSDWASPKFDGAFLPDEREVSDTGFTGSWEILDLNRNYPQSWTGSTYNIYDSAFGVELLAAVDQYHKSTRSAKYALLIIALTFLVYFSAEVFNHRRVHLVQYLLIGLALVLFYSLLVSMSEVVGFDVAYALASAATVGLITLYARSVLKNTRLVSIQALVLIFLYGFTYILLQLEDYALLVGSIGLFLILATVMYLSRKVDWYEISSR
jgi:inner membrane protein